MFHNIFRTCFPRHDIHSDNESSYNMTRVRRQRCVMKKVNITNIQGVGYIANIVDGDTFDLIIKLTANDLLAYYSTNHTFTVLEKPDNIYHILVRVRLIGTDAFESNTYYGQAASLLFVYFVKLYGNKVQFRLADKLDKFGRALGDIKFQTCDQWFSQYIKQRFSAEELNSVFNYLDYHPFTPVKNTAYTLAVSYNGGTKNIRAAKVSQEDKKSYNEWMIHNRAFTV